MPSLGIQWPLSLPGGREKPCTHYLDEDRRSRYDLRLIWKLLWCLQQQWLASPVASALGGQDGASECGRNFRQKSRRFNLKPQTTIEAGCSNGIHCVAMGRWRRWGWRLGNEHQNGIRTSRQLSDATPQPADSHDNSTRPTVIVALTGSRITRQVVYISLIGLEIINWEIWRNGQLFISNVSDLRALRLLY